MNRKPATVKWFRDDKGFGFLRFNDGDEVFVHYSQIEMKGRKTLETGQSVLAAIQETAKGRQAVGVQVVKAA